MKLFERFRKKKFCGDSEKSSPEVKKASAPLKKSSPKKEKDLIKWK